MLFEYYSNNNESVTITSSVGIALYPHDGNDFETLFEMADSALYNVKQNGKNNFRLYSDDLTESGIGKYM